jgi:phosphonate transport system substrate-binding protein
MFENDFDVGPADTLANMEEREEPVHGNPPLSVEETDADYIDPDTISYAYGQGGDAANIYQDAMTPLMENIEEETGKSVEFVTLNNPTAVVEAMRAERLHVSSVGAGTTPYLVNIGGGVPFSMLVNEGTFGYRMWTIAHVDNDDITGLSDLEGLTVAHSSETSNSGNLAPRALLPEQGLTPGEDYEVTYSGGHDNSINGVIAGDFPAANCASSIFGDMYAADEVDPSQVRVIYFSQPFPSLPVQYRYNLEPELVEGIKRAHFDYDYSGTSVEDAGGTEYVEFDYATHHHPVLLIQQSLDVEYQIGNLG